MRTIRVSVIALMCALSVLGAQTDDELQEIKAQREQQKTLLETAAQPQPPTQAELAKLEEQAGELFDKEASGFALDVSQKLSIASRTDDPFGLPVSGDLVGKRVVSSTELATGEIAEAQQEKPTYVNAVNALKVNGMNFTKGEIIVGHRIVRIGDTLTLSYAGLSFVVKVVSVKRNVIVFEDMSAGQQSEGAPSRTALNLTIIPPDRPAQFSPLPQ